MTQKHDPDAAIRKLELLLEEPRVDLFSSEEVEDIRQVIKIYRAARGAAWLAGGSATALKWAAMMIGLYLAIKAGLIDWIQGIAR